MNKLDVIVPYRNRYEQLTAFKESITKYLESKNINFELIIVEQDNAKLFNRGMLLNIGFKYALEHECDYVVFHDISSDACQGVVNFWNEIKNNYKHHEFIEQYDSVAGSYLGIGLIEL